MAIQILEPRWSKRVVGLASYRLGTTDTDVEIVATGKKDGKRYFPHLYTIKTEKVRMFPVQRLSSGVELFLVPIAELEVKQEFDR